MEFDRNRYNDDSESEEEMRGFDEEDMIRKSVPGADTSSEDELYAFYDSDEFLENENIYALNEVRDANEDSDVEDENGADESRSDRAWGAERRRFYNTDFVDNDAEDFYEGKGAEDALLEQQEGERIQSRLASELNETDFVVALRASETQTTENEKFEEIARDISSLTTREKLDLMQRESPEFFVLVKDLKNKLNEIDNVLIPVLNHFNNKPNVPAPVKFLKKKFLVLTNYCTNITFYLLLKAKRSPVENHPVLKSLYRYRRVMGEIQEIDEAMRPKIEKVLMDIKDCDSPALERLSSALKRKNLLNMIKKAREEQSKKDAEANGTKEFGENSASTSAGTSAGTSGSFTKTSVGYPEVDKETGKEEEVNGKDENPEGEIPEEEKRAITYKMAKNKGLMPKRNKLQRNPRVKHRNKYRKALIRRRGQVRFARTEIPVYGGEPSGIKAHVTKSIKFK